jgi:hypothetical protein
MAVIVGQLFASLDAALGIEPNLIAHNIRLAVGRAAVIEEAGRIPHHAPVDIIILVEGKDVGIAPIDLIKEYLAKKNSLATILYMGVAKAPVCNRWIVYSRGSVELFALLLDFTLNPNFTFPVR